MLRASDVQQHLQTIMDTVARLHTNCVCFKDANCPCSEIDLAAHIVVLSFAFERK